MGRSVAEGVLESIHDLAAVIDREAFVRDGRASDVAAKPFEGVPLMGSAARAGMEGEPHCRWVMQALSAGGLDATVRRVRALRPNWGPVAMR